MRFKIIISRALFIFNDIVNGKAQLESVHFLSDDMLQHHNDLLVVKQNEAVDFFINGDELMSRLTGEQFFYLAAAARYFGYLPRNNENMPMWFGAGSIAMKKQDAVLPLAA